MDNHYDLIVIGAGPGGYVSAIRAAQYGLKVALVESRDAGGTCLNRGCIPTKTLMHASNLYEEINHCEGLGIQVAGASYDIKKIYSRKQQVVEQLRSGVEYLVKANKVDFLRGKAVINAATSVSVGDEAYETKNILIATGSVPARPPIPGLELPGVITSDELLEQEGTAYKSLTIIGGGVIGVEFATVFHALGCKVTVIEALDRLLPTMDKEISRNLATILKKGGVASHTGSMVERIEQSENGLTCVFTAKGKTQQVESEAVLVSIGRKAYTDGLFADGVSVEFNRGIVVDEQYQTSLPGVYAIGDVISGGIQLAHVASAQGCNAVAHICGKPAQIDMNVVPSCIYTNPEIASVGLSEAQAKEQGIAVKCGKYSMSGNGKSIIEGQSRGFIKLVFDTSTNVILGAQLMCARATDLISELSTAIVNKLTSEQLAAVIRPHPTFTEGVTEAVESALGTAIHIAP